MFDGWLSGIPSWWLYVAGGAVVALVLQRLVTYFRPPAVGPLSSEWLAGHRYDRRGFVD